MIQRKLFSSLQEKLGLTLNIEVISPRWYLSSLTVTVVLAGYFQYLWQYNFLDLPVIKAQTPGIYVMLIGVAICFVFWISTAWNLVRDRLLQAILLMLILTWLSVIITAKIHNDGFTYTVVTYVPILVMLALKNPTSRDLKWTIMLFSWLILIVLVLTRVLEILGVLSVPPISDDLVRFEQKNYWLPLNGIIGPDIRWPGPMGHNAMSGVAGAYLVIVGFAVKRKSGLLFMLIGTLTLLITSSRVSMVATAVGVSVVLMLGESKLMSRFAFRLRLSVVLIAFSCAAGVALFSSPNLTGRTTIWPAFIGLWRDSPWIGVGVTGKSLGDSIINGTNAHNIFLDILAHYGIFPLVMMTVSLLGMLLLSYRAVKLGDVLPMGIVSTFIIVGLTQADHGWTEPSEPWWLLILASFLGSSIGTEGNSKRRQTPVNDMH